MKSIFAFTFLLLAATFMGVSSMRIRRQINLFDQPPQATNGNGNNANNLLKFFSDLGPQLENARLISNLFTSNLAPADEPASSGPSMAQVSQFASQLQTAFTGSTTPSPSIGMQLMNSLTETLKSAQQSSAKAANNASENIQASATSAQQNAANAAQQAQGGIQSALTEIGQGLKRIANNNPSLIPDVKNLYNNVSAKLSSASSSVSQLSPGGASSNPLAAAPAPAASPLPTPAS